MYVGLGLSQETEINEYMYLGLGLSQEMESLKGNYVKLSKPLESYVYLVLPFSFNSFRFDAEINVFAFLLTSNTLSSMLIQEHLSSNLDDRQASSTILKSSFENLMLYNLEIFVSNLTRQKRS